MIAVIFEIRPADGMAGEYFNLAAVPGDSRGVHG
jgi:hypothetical protein